MYTVIICKWIAYYLMIWKEFCSMVNGLYNSNCVSYKCYSVDIRLLLLLIDNNITINIFTIYFINKGKRMRMIPILDNVLMLPYYINILVIKLFNVKISSK